MSRLQRCAAFAIFFVAFVAARAAVIPLAAANAAPQSASCSDSDQPERYEVRVVHDPGGTGKFYMGREIANIMGPSGISWLDRPTRDAEQRPAEVIDALGLHGGEIVADLGAGSGYFTFRIAPKVGKTGKVLAVDVQDEMLDALRRHAAEQKITNVEVIKGGESDPKLPPNGVDVVLMVDVYHELSCPYEVMTKVATALKPNGRMVFVEYRKEDPKIPIRELHKMSLEQLQKEMSAVGFTLVRSIETLPVQHIAIFEKKKKQ
ncbi:MAG TPA: class I SAM-dependent methyltransferase [Candidatus Angelobacter sp.]|nr:class I SAM-dependent methyltransferase [Candidatus Angelobacter sp.]